MHETFEYWIKIVQNCIMESKSKKARSTARGKFTRATNRLDHAIKENALVITVQNRYQELRDAWKEVIEKHEEYVNELADSDEKEEDCWMSELSEVLDEIEIRTDKYLDKAHRDKKG